LPSSDRILALRLILTHGTVLGAFLVVASIFSLSRHNHSEKEALDCPRGDA
jgi:hypothetical protein